MLHISASIGIPVIILSIIPRKKFFPHFGLSNSVDFDGSAHLLPLVGMGVCHDFYCLGPLDGYYIPTEYPPINLIMSR
jgi:hypothetical protein